MTNEEEEYEVESIVAARLERKRGRKPVAQWRYRVRWKGYNSSQDTWEPQESFNGSEDIIERFWERANTEGRDYRNVSLFTAGEEFLPLGPPRRKQRKEFGRMDNSVALSSRTPSTSQLGRAGDSESNNKVSGSNKRRRNLTPSTDNHGPPAKRLRETQQVPQADKSRSVPQSTKKPFHTEGSVFKLQPNNSQSHRKRPRELRMSSPEVIPDSDEESSVQLDSQSLSKSIAPVPMTTSQSASKMPYHRMRVAAPLVKSIEEVRGPNPAEPTALHVAPKRIGLLSRNPAPKKSRSSLLTAEKGVLKSVKGKYVGETFSRKDDVTQDIGEGYENAVETVNDSMSPPIDIPVTGEELLTLAGLSEGTANNLPDFEEGADQSTVSDALASTSKVTTSLYSSQLFPSSSASETTTLPISRSLKTMTIFGSLGFGQHSKSSQVVESSSTQSSEGYPLSLVLDTSVSLPVILTDVSPISGVASLQQLVQSNGPPGKFYKPNDAHSLISTLRTVGPSGKIMITDSASEEYKLHYHRFLSRLDKDELFIALAGNYLLAFCSPISKINTLRLNIPTQLVASSQGHILVTRVEVDNFSKYADVAVKADNTRWIHYIANL